MAAGLDPYRVDRDDGAANVLYVVLFFELSLNISPPSLERESPDHFRRHSVMSRAAKDDDGCKSYHDDNAPANLQLGMFALLFTFVVYKH